VCVYALVRACVSKGVREGEAESERERRRQAGRDRDRDRDRERDRERERGSICLNCIYVNRIYVCYSQTCIYTCAYKKYAEVFAHRHI
jgi:hypothetical protein